MSSDVYLSHASSWSVFRLSLEIEREWFIWGRNEERQYEETRSRVCPKEGEASLSAPRESAEASPRNSRISREDCPQVSDSPKTFRRKSVDCSDNSPRNPENRLENTLRHPQTTRRTTKIFRRPSREFPLEDLLRTDRRKLGNFLVSSRKPIGDCPEINRRNPKTSPKKL